MLQLLRLRNHKTAMLLLLLLLLKVLDVRCSVSEMYVTVCIVQHWSSIAGRVGEMSAMSVIIKAPSRARVKSAASSAALNYDHSQAPTAPDHHCSSSGRTVDSNHV